MRLSILVWVLGSVIAGAIAGFPPASADEVHDFGESLTSFVRRNEKPTTTTPTKPSSLMPSAWVTALPSMVARCPDNPPHSSIDQSVALALPGVSGVAILTTVGTVVGYRRAKAHLAAAEALRRFIR